MISAQPISLVCVAAPIDSALLDQWEAHLRPLIRKGHITVWSEHNLQAGANWREELFAHLEQAACIVLLLSADFFANDLCLTIMERGLQRHREDDVPLIPLLVRSVAWQDSSLGMLPYLPANGIPITTWEHPDDGWLSAVHGLRRWLRSAGSTSLLPVALDKRANTDREHMLHRLHRTYQTSLDDSLQGIAWMELGLTEDPDAVRNATHLLQRLPDRTERLLPVGTRVLSVYDDAEEELLILGIPGTGKSMLLLQLALDLLTRAHTDPTHPLPIIVPLSSWANSRAKIAEWLVGQLFRIYEVPRKLGQMWVEQGQVLPLLDGLDEMEETARPLCIAAINTYHHTEHLTPLVVCSRQAEYKVAASRERLRLENAVIVQPLSQEQVVDVIRRGGPKLAGLHNAFNENPMVRELATTPLMLNVLMLTYRGTPIGDLPQQQDRLEERIWTDYVERMVRTKGIDCPSSADLPEKRYPLAQTCTSLSWLAQHMRLHNQALFYGEYLQENWLPETQQRAARWLLVRLPAMLLGVLTSLLLELFMFRTDDPAFLCQVGLAGGFLGWCFSQEKPGEPMAVPPPRRWSERLRQRYLLRLLSAILVGFLSAASWGLDLSSSYSINAWLRDGIITGITIGMSAWLFQSRLAYMMQSSDPLPPRSTSGWMQMIPGRRAIWAGVLFGIGTGLSLGLSFGWLFGPTEGLYGGLYGGLSRGLSVGGTALLVNLILDAQTGTVRLAERVHWSGRMFVQWHHLRTSLLITLFGSCVFGLINGLNVGLSEPEFGRQFVVQILGLSDGPFSTLFSGLFGGLFGGLTIGLGIGMSIGMSYWMLVGLYQGVTQEHMPDQDRRQFNQGLHRSLRNGGLLSLLSTGIITGITLGLLAGLSGGLSEGLSGGLSGGLYSLLVLHNGLGVALSEGLRAGLTYGLKGLLTGLSEWPSEWLSVGWLLTLCGWFVVWAATGGLTILHHYLLRILLARSRTFPRRARQFLDDATARVLLRQVGGGYGFVHRRLLDHFAAHPDAGCAAK